MWTYPGFSPLMAASRWGVCVCLSAYACVCLGVSPARRASPLARGPGESPSPPPAHICLVPASRCCEDQCHCRTGAAELLRAPRCAGKAISDLQDKLSAKVPRILSENKKNDCLSFSVFCQQHPITQEKRMIRVMGGGGTGTTIFIVTEGHLAGAADIRFHTRHRPQH